MQIALSSLNEGAAFPEIRKPLGGSVVDFHDGTMGQDTEDQLDSLTSPTLMSLDYVAPPSELEGFVTTFYHFRCDEREIRDVQPAAVGHVIVFLTGRGVVRFANGHTDPSHGVSLLTPCNAAAAIEIDGPFHCIGAVLSPLGWASLTGLHAGKWSDRLLAARDVLGREIDALGEGMIADYRKGADAAGICCRLGSFLLARLNPVNRRHAALMQAVATWLGSGFDPPLDDLFSASAYSPRQTQRLVERYFGLPPRELRRKYRALRVVAVLGQPDAPGETVAALTDHFYDQSHMIREIRHFVGRTPKQLTGSDDTILSAATGIRNYREVKPQFAAIPVGFPANDSQ